MKDDVVSERSEEGGGRKELSRWGVKRVRTIQLTALVWKSKSFVQSWKLCGVVNICAESSEEKTKSISYTTVTDSQEG